jgi:hypothetical protein
MGLQERSCDVNSVELIERQVSLVSFCYVCAAPMNFVIRGIVGLWKSQMLQKPLQSFCFYKIIAHPSEGRMKSRAEAAYIHCDDVS